jgi:fibronectin-binding autotransporter adhesin
MRRAGPRLSTAHMIPLDLLALKIQWLYQTRSPSFLFMSTSSMSRLNYRSVYWQIAGKAATALVFLASSLYAQATTLSHQFIGNASNWTTTASSNWSDVFPYTPPETSGGPLLGSTLDMAGINGLQISSGARAVTELTVTKAGVGTQNISGISEDEVVSLTIGSADAKDGLISLTTGNLRLFNQSAGQLFDVFVNGNVQIGAGTTLTLGNNAERALKTFSVSGSTTINGVLANHAANANTSLGDVSLGSSGALYLANLAAGSSTVTVRSLAGNGSIFSSDHAGAIGAQRLPTLSIVTQEGSDAVFAGVLANSSSSPSSAYSSLSLAVSGSGRQTLTNTNIYKGSTTITGGTLILSGNGSINNTTGIALSGGALIQKSSVALTAPITWTGGTLGGTTLITGNVSATGEGAKTLNPGDGALIGNLNISGDLALDEFTAVSLTLSGTQAGISHDTFSVGGLLALNDAVLSLTLSGYGPVAGDVFTIATFGSWDGTTFRTWNGSDFIELTNGSHFTAGGTTFQIDYAADNIQLTVVPEPHAATLALAAAGGMLVLFRRRRQH